MKGKVKKDLSGHRFGRLTVIEQANDLIDRNGRHRIMWLCRCDCGNLVIVRSESLKGGTTRSCGCYNKDRTRETHCKRNKFILFDNYGVLWTSNTDEEVYFDIEDSEKILCHCWHKDASGYARTTISGEKVRLHAFLGFKWHDHKNRNRLDNRKGNLRPCTYSQNVTNKKTRDNNTSGVIGVYWDKRTSKWKAQINIDKKIKNLGGYKNKEDAVRVRLDAEAKYYKEFAPQRHLFEKYNIKI